MLNIFENNVRSCCGLLAGDPAILDSVSDIPEVFDLEFHPKKAVFKTDFQIYIQKISLSKN